MEAKGANYGKAEVNRDEIQGQREEAGTRVLILVTQAGFLQLSL